MEWELSVLSRERLAAGASPTGPRLGWALVLSGEVVLDTAGTRTPLAAGDAVLLGPRTAYLATAVDETELVVADLRRTVASRPLPNPLVVPGFGAQHAGVVGLVTACPLGVAGRTSQFAVSYAGLVGAAMVCAWLAAAGPHGDRDDAQVAHVAAALADRPGEPWTLDRMAGLVHLSRSALTARFRRSLEMSPMQLLRDVRMERARVLLRDRSSPVTRVAFEVGYGSVAAFSRAFAAQHGVSPDAWRAASVARDARQRPDQARTGGGRRADEQRYADAVPVQESAARG